MIKKVLIVDDMKHNRDPLRLILNNSGMEVLEACTGEDGIKAAKESLPDLVFMDLQLPGIDGIHAAQTIKADPATSRIIVISFTSHVMKEDKDKLMALGFDGYLTKPADEKEVHEILRCLNNPVP
ncbi:MAG: response regulator [Deltaproteobacteria bacterium]|nr:response regulator [Deltaproteobacteria bacterium]